MNIEISNKEINNSNVKTDVYINVSSNKLIRFVGFPGLDVTVYGRNEEVGYLISFFLSHNRHCSIVAPSCFGKTFLIKKFLQRVNEQDETFKDSFDKIIYFNCREIADVVSVCNNFVTCLGIGELNPSNLFAFIQNEKILCIFDNFEDWNKNDNQEINTFLHRIFTINNQLRTIFVSQSAINDRNIKDHVEDLTEIKDKLFKGLDKQSALEFIKAEAQRKNVNLENIADEKLDEFFQKVYYIPQAIRSLIDYLNLKRRTFADFIQNYQAEFEVFEKSEKRFTENYNDELRPTLYMIKVQIEAQDEKSKNLLGVLSFFGRNVPQILITAFSEQVDVTEEETIHLLTHNRLVEETKVFRGKDFYYYSPHSIIKDVAREVLPKFEDKYSGHLEPLVNALFAQAFNNHDKQHNYEEAISLYECEEKLLDYLINHNGRTELANDLAMAYLNKGNSLAGLGRSNEAIDEYNKTIAIRQSLVESGKTELANDLASAYLNKGNSLYSLGRLNEAIDEYDKAIEILQSLVEAGRSELANDLASAYMNKGNALEQNAESAEAVKIFSEASHLWETELSQGFLHNLPNLVKALRIRVQSLIILEDWANIASDAVKSLTLAFKYTQDENISEHHKQLINEEFGRLLYQIKQLSSDNQEKIFVEANKIGQSEEYKTPFGDILRELIE